MLKSDKEFAQPLLYNSTGVSVKKKKSFNYKKETQTKILRNPLFVVSLILLTMILFLVYCWIILITGNWSFDVQTIQESTPFDIQPEQIHLSLGENAAQMVVTWTTFNHTATSTVWYGIDRLNQYSNTGTQTKFTDDGPAKRSMWIHRVYLNNLKPNTTYRYHVGSTDGISSVYSFRTFPDAQSSWSPRFMVYGDMGNTNARTLAHIQNEIQNGEHDLVLHVGDFAYDMHDNDAKVGDAFMRQLEPIAAYVPYQVCPGNHEEAYNFSNYDSRFSMHSQGSPVINNHFWSYNIGPVHLISFSTEFHFFTEYGTQQIMNQYRWLVEDLKRANQPEARKAHPWIITIGHRPFYSELPSVDQEDELIRVGNKDYPGFEQLFYEYGVDLHLWGHVHNYERMWPIYDGKVYNGSTEEPYRNPKAPVHITTGSAGCNEYLTPVLPKRPTYHAKVVSDYGFLRMHVLNRSHIHLQQTSEAKGGQVVDDLYLIKDTHGPKAWL